MKKPTRKLAISVETLRALQVLDCTMLKRIGGAADFLAEVPETGAICPARVIAESAMKEVLIRDR